MPDRWERFKWPAAVAGVSLVLCSCVYVHVVDQQTDLLARTFLFSFVSLGSALCLPAIRSIRKPRSRWIAGAVAYISLWSYSAYLCHWTIRRGLTLINVKMFDLGFGSLASSLVIWAAFFLLTAVISAASYTIVERWGLRMRERFSRR